jgi:hypothetical protein
MELLTTDTNWPCIIGGRDSEPDGDVAPEQGDGGLGPTHSESSEKHSTFHSVMTWEAAKCVVSRSSFYHLLINNGDVQGPL